MRARGLCDCCSLRDACFSLSWPKQAFSFVSCEESFILAASGQDERFFAGYSPQKCGFGEKWLSMSKKSSKRSITERVSEQESPVLATGGQNGRFLRRKQNPAGRNVQCVFFRADNPPSPSVWPRAKWCWLPFAASCMLKAMRARGLRDCCSANTAAGPAARFEHWDPLCIGARVMLWCCLAFRDISCRFAFRNLSRHFAW